MGIVGVLNGFLQTSEYERRAPACSLLFARVLDSARNVSFSVNNYRYFGVWWFLMKNVNAAGFYFLPFVFSWGWLWCDICQQVSCEWLVFLSSSLVSWTRFNNGICNIFATYQQYAMSKKMTTNYICAESVSDIQFTFGCHASKQANFLRRENALRRC